MVMQCLGAICGAGAVKGFQKGVYESNGGGANIVASGYSKGAAWAPRSSAPSSSSTPSSPPPTPRGVRGTPMCRKDCHSQFAWPPSPSPVPASTQLRALELPSSIARTTPGMTIGSGSSGSARSLELFLLPSITRSSSEQILSNISSDPDVLRLPVRSSCYGLSYHLLLLECVNQVALMHQLLCFLLLQYVVFFVTPNRAERSTNACLLNDNNINYYSFIHFLR
ncbi:hypothetical protein B296_00011133 [Ensete ventricosum]|uniref:Uncharacterized protein n=1 Tax=Ensete ventricosum TaxID=4639 RepID=A0A427A639_ENSVE|nr:hypothetical protein B296_00011133 [Ensete ventricosum]